MVGAQAAIVGVLSSVLSNVLSNALKFTMQGGITLRVIARPESRLRFEVADAAALDFHDDFDRIVSFNALHWVPMPARSSSVNSRLA